MKLKYFLITLLFLASSSVFALETNTSTITNGTNTSTTNGQSAVMTQNQNEEAAILASIIALDKNEIAVAKEALKRKLDPQVKAFAKLMILQHGINLREALSLSKRLHITPNNDSASSIKDEGDNLLAQLKPLDDTQFQKSYIDAMVKGHQEALSLVQDDITKVQNPKLKRFLESTEKAVKTHLEKAQKVQTVLAKQ